MNLGVVMALINKPKRVIKMKSDNGTEFTITVENDGTLKANPINYLSDIEGENITTKDGDKILLK